MAKLRMVVAASSFFGVLVLGTGLIAQQRAGGVADQAKGIDPSVRSLIEDRIKVVKEIFETAMAPPLNGPLGDLPAWSRRWMDEKVRLNPDDPAKNRDAIQEHLERLRNLEAIAVQRHEGGRGTEADVLKVRYFRLDAEQMLLELRIINPGLFPPKP